MLIVCPSCASEYMIDPGRLGAEGRTVRCAKCKETWFVSPEIEDPEEEAAEVATATPVENDEDAAAWEQFSNASEAASEDELGKYPASMADDGPRAAVEASKWSRRLPTARPLLVLAILVIAGSALWGRAHIVRAVPATAGIYATIGLPVNLRGLEFRGVRSELMAGEGDPILVVEGEIANISGREASVPPIEIGVRGAEGQMLYTWTNDPPRNSLATSDTAHFRARLAAPPAEGRQVLVRFAAGRSTSAAVANQAR